MPATPPSGVVVRVAGCGLCHSDLTMMSMSADIGEALGWSMPFTLGHETAGWIESVGPDVEGWAVGDAVAVMSPMACGVCSPCAAGWESACTTGGAGRGYGRDGGLADFVAVESARALVGLGSMDPHLAGPLTDAGATSHHAVVQVLDALGRSRSLGVDGLANATVAIIGAGGLGAFAIQILRASSPVRIVVVEPDEGRRDRSRSLGADEVVADAADLARASADAVIDIVGIDATIARGVRALRPGGRMVVVGSELGTLSRPWFSAMAHDAQFSVMQGSDRSDLTGVMALAAAGKVRVDAEIFDLDSVDEGFRRLAESTLTGRAVVLTQPMVADAG